MVKKIKYDPKITLKKGAVATLIAAIAGLIVTFILEGGIEIANPTLAAVVIGAAKMLENYLKNR